MRGFSRFAITFIVLVCLAKPAISQNRSSGEIRGTVMDASGAVLPGVTVTLVDINTGVKTVLNTNADGIYDSVSTRTGTYNVSFEKQGFKKMVRGPIVLQVDTITEDATLQVGAVTEEVRVNAEGAPLLETETGQQATTLDAKTMNELPQTGAGITGNDWANFTAFLPGGESTAGGRVSEGSGAWNAGDAIALNGNLPNYANFLADGATTQLPVSNNNDNMTFESVAEVQINTSSFSAQYGLGGAVFNQVSKGGTNSFHGSAYEYWQNNILNAGSYFGDNVPYLRYDEWGGSVGGPIIKNKLFFYFNRDKIYDFSGANQGFTTVPTDAMKAGDFSGSGLPAIYDPTTTTGSTANGTFSRTQFPGNMITTIDPVAQAVLKYWPEPNVTCPGGVSFCTNNYFYKQASPNPNLRYFGRIDYNYSQANHVTFSISQKNNNGYNKNQLPCPINCYSGDIDGYQAQVTDTWTISPTMVNEIRMGYTKQGNWFVPATNGFDPTTIGLQYAKFTQFPNFNIGGANAVNSLNPGTYAIYIENLYDPSDVVTLIRGRHILHFGIEVLMGEGNTTPWGAHDAGSFAFNGNYTAGPNATGTGVDPTTGAGFADFLLGDVQTWGANNQGLTGMRLKSPQAFVQDDFKLRPNLTLNVGLRYMGTTGMSEEHNRIGGFDPDLINPVGPFAGTSGSVWFAGQDNRTTSQAAIWDIFLPRVGFAWLLGYNTTVRGGFGLYAYNFSQDDYGGGIGFGSNSTGNAADQSGGTGTTPLIYLSSPAATAATVLPYIQASTSPASYILSPPIGLGYVPYHVTPGKIEEWSLAVEHQFGRDFAGSVAYVGSHGFNLQFPTNLNQITNPAQLGVEDIAACNGSTATTGSYTGSDACFRPYPAFAGLGGSNYNAISNYDSLQLQVTKRYSYGLSFNVNYVWSHLLDDQDSSGWGSTAGPQNWQIANDPSANYSNSNFDTRNAFKGYVVYELPVGEGKTYLSQMNPALDAVLGGWKISSTFIKQSGNPFTMWDSQDNSYAQGGETWYPNIVSGVSPTSGSCPNGDHVGTLGCWFNTAAFAPATPGTFGDSRRTSLVGPGLTVVNISMGKTFHWRERIAFELRGDFVNALNHPSFYFPNSDVSSGSEGVINSVSVAPRSGQLSGRLSF
jgi:carboxypeptidase family protein